MILIDTSVWIDHLRQPEPKLAALVGVRNVLGHPFVLGEIAMGSFKNRENILTMLRRLPQAVAAREDDVHAFVTRHSLFGLGIGYIDAHLLVSAQLSPNTLIWSRDKRLLAVAEGLGLAMVELPLRLN
jgi:predicted nucleic acid-binding protein